MCTVHTDQVHSTVLTVLGQHNCTAVTMAVMYTSYLHSLHHSTNLNHVWLSTIKYKLQIGNIWAWNADKSNLAMWHPDPPDQCLLFPACTLHPCRGRTTNFIILRRYRCYTMVSNLYYDGTSSIWSNIPGCVKTWRDTPGRAPPIDPLRGRQWRLAPAQGIPRLKSYGVYKQHCAVQSHSSLNLHSPNKHGFQGIYMWKELESNGDNSVIKIAYSWKFQQTKLYSFKS